VADQHGRDKQLREAIELFYFAYRAFTAGPDSILSERGLGRVHHRILYFVGRNPSIAVHSLLEILQVSKQALNTPLRQLVEEHLVSVSPDDRDRRFKRITLTHEGSRLEGQLTGTQMKQLAAVFDEAGARNETAWKSMMRTMSGR
jgi:DNA-binding MarR family transcriptional regulator